MLSKIIQATRAAGRTFAKNVQLLLLAAFPFADQIMLALAAHLPAAAPYLPENVYKWLGLAVVLFNVLRSHLVKRRAAALAAAAVVATAGSAL